MFSLNLIFVSQCTWCSKILVRPSYVFQEERSRDYKTSYTKIQLCTLVDLLSILYIEWPTKPFLSQIGQEKPINKLHKKGSKRFPKRTDM